MKLQPINAPRAYDRSNEQQFRTAVANALGQISDPFAAPALKARMAASEDIADGAFCNIWSNSGVCELRNADNSAPGREAHVFVLEGCSAGGAPAIYGPGSINTAVSGQTPGAQCWLGASGGAAETPPTAEHSGAVVQAIGKALSATSILFLRGEPVTL